MSHRVGGKTIPLGGVAVPRAHETGVTAQSVQWSTRLDAAREAGLATVLVDRLAGYPLPRTSAAPSRSPRSIRVDSVAQLLALFDPASSSLMPW